MGITLSGISNDLLSTTIYEIADEVAEGLFETTPFLSMSRKLGKIKSFNGGYKLVVPVETKVHSQVTVLDSGWEALDLSVQDFTSRLSTTGHALPFQFLSLAAKRPRTAATRPSLTLPRLATRTL